MVKLAIAGAALAAALYLGERPLGQLAPRWPLRDEVMLLALAVIGLVVYGGAVLALFGRQWLAAFRGRKQTAPPPNID